MEMFAYLHHQRYTYSSKIYNDLLARHINGVLSVRGAGYLDILTAHGREAENLILRLYEFQTPAIQRRIDKILREWKSTLHPSM